MADHAGRAGLGQDHRPGVVELREAESQAAERRAAGRPAAGRQAQLRRQEYGKVGAAPGGCYARSEHPRTSLRQGDAG